VDVGESEQLLLEKVEENIPEHRQSESKKTTRGEISVLFVSGK